MGAATDRAAPDPDADTGTGSEALEDGNSDSAGPGPTASVGTGVFATPAGSADRFERPLVLPDGFFGPWFSTLYPYPYPYP
jgi:hypothetical protein